MVDDRTMPRCAAIPEVGYDDVGAAIDWLCSAFGFTERWRVGRHRAQLAVGGGAAVAVRDRGARGGTDVLIRIGDVDRHHARAVRAGADVVDPPTDHPFGERRYSVLDLAGHRWTFSQSIADVAPEAWGGTTKDLTGSPDL